MSIPVSEKDAYYFPVAKNALGALASNGEYLSKASFEQHFNLLLLAPFLVYVGWTNVTKSPTAPLHNNFYRVLYVAGAIQFLWSLWELQKIHKNIFLVAILACCSAIIYLLIYAVGNRPVCSGPTELTTVHTTTAKSQEPPKTKTEEELEYEDEE